MTLLVIFLWGLFGEGDGLEVKPITPECGGSHCQITVEEAKAIARLQAVLAESLKRRRCTGADT